MNYLEIVVCVGLYCRDNIDINGELFLPKEIPSPIFTIGVLYDLPYCLQLN
jgi:hypothetical protein